MADPSKPTDSAASPVAQVRGGPVVQRRVTEELAAFSAKLSPDEVPAPALEAAKRLALDFTGIALRGSLEPSSRAVAATLERLSPAHADGATVIGHARSTSPQYAALANGTSLHGLELDDIQPEGGIHPGGPIFAAALAVGEAVGANGRDLLAAAVAGYEVSCRLAMALPLSEHVGHGFHPTGTCGVFSAATVAARLLGLTADQTVNAYGIAGSQAAGSLEYRTEGAWTKRLHPGWAAHSGIIAAELARSGFVGPRRILEGRAGFLRSYSDNPRIEGILTGLGADYQILRTAIKPHAACRYSQGAIDAMLRLVLQHDLQPGEIEQVSVGLLKAAFPTVAEPITQKRRPRSMVEAQFSVHFAVAVAAMWRRVTVAEYRPECLTSAEVHALMDRVECVPAPELDALFPKLWPTTVEIALRDGRRLQTRVDHLKGDPENPLSWEEVAAKFDSLAAELIPADRRAEIIAAVRDLENRPVRSVTDLLRSKSIP